MREELETISPSRKYDPRDVKRAARELAEMMTITYAKHVRKHGRIILPERTLSESTPKDETEQTRTPEPESDEIRLDDNNTRTDLFYKAANAASKDGYERARIVNEDPEMAIRIMPIYKDSQIPSHKEIARQLGLMFITRYSKDPEYNSAAHFVSEDLEIGNVSRMRGPETNTRITQEN